MRELNHVLKARRALESEHTAQGTEAHVRVEDIAARLGRPAAEVSDLLRFSELPASLDAPLDRESNDAMIDGVADDAALDPMYHTLSHEVALLLQSGLEELNDREREVLSGRYGLRDREPETLEVLAERLSLTRERIRQIQQEALVKLRRRMARSGVHRDALF